MTKIEQAYHQQLTEKFGVKKLETEPLTRSNMFDQHQSAQTVFQHYERHQKELKEKFGMDSLKLEGALGQRLERTLDDAVREDSKGRMAGMKLATAKIVFQNKPVRFWFEISR
jgi:hypothetical protein